MPLKVTQLYGFGVPGKTTPLFFLRTNFNAANQSFSNNEIIRTTGKGMTDGALQINNLGAGTIGISSNALAMAPSAGNVTVYFSIVPRTKALVYQIRSEEHTSELQSLRH